MVKLCHIFSLYPNELAILCSWHPFYLDALPCLWACLLCCLMMVFYWCLKKKKILILNLFIPCQASQLLLVGYIYLAVSYNFSSYLSEFYWQRHKGDPLRVYMDLEAGRKRSGMEDLFISYHANDDVQSTYAGGLFHNNRNYHVSAKKNNVSYWLYFVK